MIPAAFVVLPQLPLTPNGKIDRKALPVPDSAATADTDGREPRTATERTLTAHFTDLLHDPHITIDDNFFTRGGHSLLAVELAQRIEQDTGIRPSLREVFAAPTPAELAELVDRATAQVVPAPRDADRAEGGRRCGGSHHRRDTCGRRARPGRHARRASQPRDDDRGRGRGRGQERGGAGAAPGGRC